MTRRSPVRIANWASAEPRALSGEARWSPSTARPTSGEERTASACDTGSSAGAGTGDSGFAGETDGSRAAKAGTAGIETRPLPTRGEGASEKFAPPRRGRAPNDKLPEATRKTRAEAPAPAVAPEETAPERDCATWTPARADCAAMSCAKKRHRPLLAHLPKSFTPALYVSCLDRLEALGPNNEPPLAPQ